MVEPIQIIKANHVTDMWTWGMDPEWEAVLVLQYQHYMNIHLPFSQPIRN